MIIKYKRKLTRHNFEVYTRVKSIKVFGLTNISKQVYSNRKVVRFSELILISLSILKLFI